MRKNKPSASGMFRLALCPGSWQAEQKSPEPPPSADAALGTALHAHMQHGTTPDDPTHADAILWCTTQETLLAEALLPNASLATIIREERLWAPYEAYSGQADVIYLSEDTALVLDYKFGRNAVEPAGSNTQLLALSNLVLTTFPKIHTVHAGILAPFVTRSAPQIVTYTRPDLPAISTTIAGYISAATTPNAPLRPSLHACRYCRASASCPAASQHTLTCAQVTSWVQLPLPDRAELYRRAQLAKKLAADIEAHCREDLAAGLELPGLTLKPGKTLRKLSHTEELAALCVQHNISASEFCTPSLPALEKAYHTRLKASNPKYTLKQASADLASALPSSISSSISAPSVTEI